MFQTQDYRQILKQKLEERCRVNPRYSMRAFARDLEIAPSRLSEILRGKQGLSRSYSDKIADRIGLNGGEKRLFTSMVVLADSRSRKEREGAKQLLAEIKLTEQKFLELREDTFRVIEDWYHYALLELTTLSGFKSDVSWISRRLGITTYETELAIERLKRLNLLKEVGGRLISTNAALTTGDQLSSESIRKFNRQILSKASDAISTQTIDEREIGSVTLAIDKRDLPEFKQMLRQFRRKFNQTAMEKSASRGTKTDQVYCLALQFFRLTEKDSL